MKKYSYLFLDGIVYILDLDNGLSISMDIKGISLFLIDESMRFLTNTLKDLGFEVE